MIRQFSVLAAVVILAGCSTKQADFQQGLYAGEAKVRTENLTTNLASIAETNIQRVGAYEQRDLNQALANAKQSLYGVKDPQTAVNAAVSVGIEWAQKVRTSQDSRAADLGVVGSIKDGLFVLAQAPVDVLDMSTAKAAALNSLGKHAAGSALKAAVPFIGSALTPAPAPVPDPTPAPESMNSHNGDD